MNTLFLDALATRRIFICYRIVRNPDGSTDKVPCDPHTGRNIDPHDSQNWLLPHEALLYAQALGDEYGVGVVITPDCGIFFIDLDHAREGDGWKPYVQAFVNRFPGCYVETSYSWEGIHLLVAYYGPLPPHGTRNRAFGMEGYSKLRFCALTGLGASGSPLVDHTESVQAFVAEFFPPSAAVDHGVEWTSEPVGEWSGPTDDEELVRRAIASQGIRQFMGRSSSFVDLWEANEEILCRLFPPTKDGPYDRSSADQAFANHLAFWTGSNCERMAKLWRESALNRDKLDREGYVRGTILNACASQNEWYSGPADLLTAPATSDGVSNLCPSDVPSTAESFYTRPKLPAGIFARIDQVRERYVGCCYVENINQIQLPGGVTVDKSRFDNSEGGPLFAMDAHGKTTKSAWDAFILSEIYQFPKVTSQYFKPDEPAGHIRMKDGKPQINAYYDPSVLFVGGDVSLFLQLVERMLPIERDRNILLFYMASLVQNIGKKFPWTIVLQGTKGNGKTTIARILQYCISPQYTHWARAKEVDEKFNAVFANKILVIIDEMLVSEDKAGFEETLRQMVTDTNMEIRGMHADKVMREVCFNMFLISNHKTAVRIRSDERRYAPLFCAQQFDGDNIRDGLTPEFFIKLNTWLEQGGFAFVYDYLRKLSIPDEFNPATGCTVAPKTSSSKAAITASLGPVEMELYEAIQQRREGLRGGWINSMSVDTVLAQAGKLRYAPRHTRQGMIESLGYTLHPSLEEGRLQTPLTDGSLPQLYIRRDHPICVEGMTEPQVLQAYLTAQKV